MLQLPSFLGWFCFAIPSHHPSVDTGREYLGLDYLAWQHCKWTLLSHPIKMLLSDLWSCQSCGQQQQMYSSQLLISHSWDEKQGWTSLPLSVTVTGILWPGGRLLFASHGWVLRVCQHPPAQIRVASIAPTGTALANWAALEKARGAARTRPCQGLCCLRSYCLLLEICRVG